MIKIRPHHLLCMRAYIGNGYSEEFKIEMEKVIKELKVYNEFLKSDNLNNDIKKVKIVFNTDSLCEKCPNKLCENKCASQEKVSLIDEKMIKYFSIKEGKFDFADEVSEEEKIMAREKAYQNYNPQKHI